MKKTVAQYLIVWTLMFIVIYGGFAFGAFSLNPSEWNVACRSICAAFVGVMSVIIIAMCADDVTE
jgi:hypothetical protein